MVFAPSRWYRVLRTNLYLGNHAQYRHKLRRLEHEYWAMFHKHNNLKQDDINRWLAIERVLRWVERKEGKL